MFEMLRPLSGRPLDVPQAELSWHLEMHHVHTTVAHEIQCEIHDGEAKMARRSASHGFEECATKGTIAILLTRQDTLVLTQPSSRNGTPGNHGTMPGGMRALPRGLRHDEVTTPRADLHHRECETLVDAMLRSEVTT